MENLRKKFEHSNDNKFKYKLFTRNSDLDNYHKNNSVKNSSFMNQYLKTNNDINSFRYDKLYFYEKAKKFSEEMKKNKTKKIKINLKKISKFHQICIHNKIKPITESQDLNDLTLNDGVLDFSEYNQINISNNTKTKYLLTHSQNLQNYNKEIASMKNNDIIKLKTKNITLDKTSSRYIDNEIYTDIGNCQRSLLNNNKISRKKILNSVEIKTPINILNYKFKNILGNPNDNIYSEGEFCPYRHQVSILSEQMKTKLKLNIINKMQNDFFQTQKEKLTNPVNVYNHYEKFNDKNKQYFELFVTLIKKYFNYLYLNIENEKKKLMLLKERKDNLKDEIFQINKKINVQKEKKNFFQNLLKLLIKIRYNVDDIDKIPNEYLKKYGIMKISRNNRYASQIFKKRNSMLITELKDIPYMKYRKNNKYNNNQKIFNLKRMSRKKTVLMDFDEIKSKNISYKSKSPDKRRRTETYELKPKIPIFNSANELDSKMKVIQYNLLQSFKQLSDKRYSIQRYKLELNEVNLEFIKNNKNKNSVYSFIQLEKEDAKIIKQRYHDLLEFKNLLLCSKDDYIEFKSSKENISSNKRPNNKFYFSEKLISYILKINNSINIEKLLKQKGIYKFLISPQETKISYKSKEYNKTLFCLKILESVLLYLIKERNKFLSDENKKDKYLGIQEMIDKKNRIIKLKEISKNEYIKTLQKEKEILLKYNKFIILPIKKDDSFSSYMTRNRAIQIANKKIAKTETNDKINSIIENEILY